MGRLLACSRPSVGGAARRVPSERGKNEGVWEGRTRPFLPLSRFDSLAFFARRCFRSLPPIESLEQASRVCLQGMELNRYTPPWRNKETGECMNKLIERVC